MNTLKEKVTVRDAVRWRGMDKVGEYKYKTKLDEDWKTGKSLGKKNLSFNRLAANDRLNDQLQKQHKFIAQTFREFYEDVRAYADAQTNINDISSGSSKPSCKLY